MNSCLRFFFRTFSGFRQPQSYSREQFINLEWIDAERVVVLKRKKPGCMSRAFVKTLITEKVA
ncbi:hypothetical protein CH367_17785 [Leptospira barantonii]|uniref:Uncharacterized protein n=1 Tax=Leptospira barantonii TaxID=2023184 RepID=A0ABX4NG12_9LEPT|nr:hypothetical protein CH367_17785 [Leptospira barantonii]